MPSEAPVLQTQTEKPNHYTYLKEFRTQQCPLFLQHKCTNHRPFTCFHWHFMNQRRRRPIRRRDGTFNYSPDTYCTKYDETTGICSDGDDCSFLHRTAGDTERRYHLRYYKTSVCVHETDGKGFCTKNGHHCAFAHGVHDMRNPVHDVREMQDAGIGAGVNNVADSPLGTTVEKDRQINEDPKWNDTNYVLANYKTDPCKRPPRLCRQGYACPSYHNTRDRRRSPKKIKYRSTPCPNVKHGDDWGDPSQCENQDNCTYCHTRTEQQFHPEIYKSSKCNDMVQAGYCPRGPFCAFAHVEQEMTNQREYAADMDNNLSHFFDIILPDTEEEKQQAAQNGGNGQNAPSNALPPAHSVTEQHNTNGGSFFNSSSSSVSRGWGLSGHASSFPEPIGKGRTGSFSSSVASDGFLSKAIGSEREEHGSIKQLLTAIDNDMSIDHAEKQKRKQDLVMSYSQSNAPLSPCSIGSNIWNADPASASGTSTQPGNNPFSVTMSPNANSYYPPGDTVESVIGNALEEDLNMGEMTINDLAKDTDNDSNSVCSSLSTGFNGGSHAQGGYLGATSVPVSIPSSGGGPTSNNGIGGLDWSPGTSPMGSMHGAGAAAAAHLQKLQGGSAATAFLSQPNTTSKLAASVGYSSSVGTATDFNSSSSSTITPGAGASSMSPLFTAGQFAAMNGSRYNEEQRLREELAAYKLRLEQWENSMGQAREACVAWQREAETATRRVMQMEEDRVQAYKQRDEALAKVSQQSKEVDFVKNNPWFHAVTRGSELENLPVSVIKQMQAQLIVDLDMLEKLVYQKEANKCLICKENNRAVGVRPCNHYVMCERCAGSCTECPFCKQAIEQRTSAIMPGNAVSGGGSSASNNNQQQLPSHQSSASAL